MKYRMAFGVFLVMLLAVVAACSGAATTTTSQQTSQTPAGSSPTGAPSSTGMQTVNVTLLDDQIVSSMMNFVPGMRYHFVVTNKGHSPYTFAMMSQDREQDMEHMSTQEREHAALYMSSSIVPGQTMTFDHTFGASMMGQHLELACYQQGHNAVHMRLPFDLEPHN